MQKSYGVLLVNLGSPDSTKVKDVRRYLDEFLMDKRVFDYPYLLRRFIVGAFILPFRPKQSAEAYEKIWTKEGSPLIVTSYAVKELLQKKVDVPVGLGMSYRKPSIKAGIDEILQQKPDIEEILLIPMYPHYAMSTFESVVEAVKNDLRGRKKTIALNIIKPYYQHPLYMKALTESAKPWLESDYDYLLFSYHGLPERHLRKSDPTGAHCLKVENCCFTPSPAHEVCYRHQCFRTTQLFAEHFKLDKSKYSVAFQSRLGKDPWLTPFTDETIARLAKEGIKKLLVICPAFVSDCLETLEEIGMGGKETFLEHGGEEFRMIPCMNEHEAWIEALASWARKEDLELQPSDA